MFQKGDIFCNSCCLRYCLPIRSKRRAFIFTQCFPLNVGWCKGVVYLTSLGRPADIGLQLGKACYPCNR